MIELYYCELIKHSKCCSSCHPDEELNYIFKSKIKEYEIIYCCGISCISFNRNLVAQLLKLKRKRDKECKEL